MCSRYCLTLPPEAVRTTFGLASIDPFPPRYNIAPLQPVGVVRHSPRHVPEFQLVRWGLIPSWVKMPAERAPLINARAETTAGKPSFRGAMRHRRCLVPATGFYEWTRRRGARTPYLIRPREGGLLALAGLWEHWVGADGSEIETMAILTVPANAVVQSLHDRMPAILPPVLHADWLDCRSGSSIEAEALLQPVPDERLEAIALTPHVNDPAHDGPAVQEPAEPRLL